MKTLIANEMIYSMVALRNGGLVSSSDKGHISIWDVEEETVKKNYFYGPSMIWCLAMDLKDRLAVGMGNGDIRVLKIRN